MTISGSPLGSRAFVDEPVRDLAAATAAAAYAASQWSLPDPAFLRGGMNATFRAGEVILRVGRPTAPAQASLALHRLLTSAGLLVPEPARDEVVMVDDLVVTAWVRVVDSGSSVDWATVGACVARLHELPISQVPAPYPVCDPRTLPWWDFDRLMSDVGSSIDTQARLGLERAIGRWGDWGSFDRQETVVCHGDVHPGNVSMTAEGPVLLDWDLLCRAPRGWDHGPLLTWHERWGGGDVYDQFAAGYGWSGRGDVATQCFAELRLVAATLMRVKAARSDPAAAPEAERRLRYWRGEEDAPAWTAQ